MSSPSLPFARPGRVPLLAALRVSVRRSPPPPTPPPPEPDTLRPSIDRKRRDPRYPSRPVACPRRRSVVDWQRRRFLRGISSPSSPFPSLPPSDLAVKDLLLWCCSSFPTLALSSSSSCSPPEGARYNLRPRKLKFPTKASSHAFTFRILYFLLCA